MRKPSFADIFPGEFFSYITKYSEQIQDILNKYEIVMFMARKAVCFYEAMVLNGVITPTNCKVISSRTTDYNVLSGCVGKELAVIDDVVVKGDSLKHVVSRLKKHKIHANVLVVACEKDYLNAFRDDSGFTLMGSYVALSKKDIYAFAGMITEYIEASMCPFNIDQPIYTMSLESDLLNKFLYHNHSVDITSGIQEKFDIHSNVVYFGLQKNDLINTRSFNLLNDSVLKIRFLSKDNCITVIPFVLLPEISNAELEKLFRYISTDKLASLAYVENEFISRENMMKIVSYFLSELLADVFFSKNEMYARKQTEYDLYLFSNSTENLFSNILSDVYDEFNNVLMHISAISIEYSKYQFPSILSNCYQMISQINPKLQSYTNSQKKRIDDEIIVTYGAICECISLDTKSRLQLASSVVDVLIDRGVIVPSIVHTENGILRAYKMGEYSKLTRSQIEAFAAMLYEYQTMIEDVLNKTEFEKLCVLFFRMLQNKGIFPQQETFEDGCYSICYSLYGPRVSTSNVSYKVGADSALITDFCNIDDKKRILVSQKHGKYIIHPIGQEQKYKSYTTAFAYTYSYLRKVFSKHNTAVPEKKSKTKWNMFVRTYIQYLTLRAIGNNKKNQFLSLCAELDQIVQLPSNLFSFMEDNRDSVERILSGINSGIWKYWCYKNEALEKTTNNIFEIDQRAGTLLLFEQEPVFDQHSNWQVAIDKAGELLYRSAFFINEVLTALNAHSKLMTKDGIYKSSKLNGSSSRKTIFTLGSYYNKDKRIVEIRHKIEQSVRVRAKQDDFITWCENKLSKIKQEARSQLNVCDAILSNRGISNYIFFEKVLILYSRTGEFPEIASAELNELLLDGIKNRECIRIFGFTEEKDINIQLAKILYTAGISCSSPLRSYILDLSNSNYGALQIGKESTGLELASKINQVTENFQKLDLDAGEMFYISPKELREFAQRNNMLLQPIESSNVDSRVRMLSEIFEQNGGDTPVFIYIVEGIRLEFDTYLKRFKEELEEILFQSTKEWERILSRSNEEIKNAILEALLEALSAINNKDESKFKAALSKTGTIIIDVFSQFAGGLLLHLYMKQTGLLP
ncbi:MAG: hypothetical protein GX910_04295 [Clostridiaceae bacterium]|nr:hypothetical protein [Clostridiaceae bacterium]